MAGSYCATQGGATPVDPENALWECDPRLHRVHYFPPGAKCQSRLDAAAGCIEASDDQTRCCWLVACLCVR